MTAPVPGQRVADSASGHRVETVGMGELLRYLFDTVPHVRLLAPTTRRPSAACP